jgi:hypothetical protein
MTIVEQEPVEFTEELVLVGAAVMVLVEGVVAVLLAAEVIHCA